MVCVIEFRDPVSSVSHLATALWAVYATLLLLRLTPPRDGRRAAVLVYGASMVLLFLASGTFHGLYYESDEQKRFFQKLDQSAVYLLIAGTNTPVLAVLLRGAWRTWFLRMVWLFALTGVACQWLLPKPPHVLVVGLYLGLGWLGAVPAIHYYRAVGWRAMNWALLGAGFYTAGAVCELTQWPVIVPGWVQAHEVLHFCDTAASMAFFVFVARYVVPYEPPDTQPVAASERHSTSPSSPDIAAGSRSHFLS
jgi:hemolysin III